MSAASGSKDTLPPGDGDPAGDQQEESNSKKRKGSSSSSSGPALIKDHVHQEFNQTSKRVGKVLKWESQCKHCGTVLKNRDKKGLLTHLKAFHKEAAAKVTLLNSKNEEKKNEELFKILHVHLDYCILII